MPRRLWHRRPLRHGRLALRLRLLPLRRRLRVAWKVDKQEVDGKNGKSRRLSDSRGRWKKSTSCFVEKPILLIPGKSKPASKMKTWLRDFRREGEDENSTSQFSKVQAENLTSWFQRRWWRRDFRRSKMKLDVAISKVQDENLTSRFSKVQADVALQIQWEDEKADLMVRKKSTSLTMGKAKPTSSSLNRKDEKGEGRCWEKEHALR